MQMAAPAEGGCAGFVDGDLLDHLDRKRSVAAGMSTDIDKETMSRMIRTMGAAIHWV